MHDRQEQPGPHPHVAFTGDEHSIARFFLLLQQGVMLRCRVGCSVSAFLHDEMGAAPETIERIQSIMLDGKPVDDIGAAVIHDGSTLALSAAMPGLVGATLRRGGAYSSFRSAITYQETGELHAAGAGWVRVKIFNLLMAELGPRLLEKGVLLDTAALFDFLSEQAEKLRQGTTATLEGRLVSLDGLRGDQGLARAAQVLLTVSARQGGA